MAKFLQYRDGGKTDEKGISTHLAGLFTGEVINGMAVTQNSPLGMSVLVSEGRVMIDSGSDYPYLGFTDANEVVTITTADGSNPRIDAIVAYIDLSVVDSTNANNPGAFKIVAVAGTPAGSPSAPNNSAISTAIGSGNPFIRLANVTVGTGVTTITTGNVSDQRVMANVADGLVDTNSLATEAVETAKIKDGAVTPVKWTNPYKFSVYLPSNQALSSSTWTKAHLSSENFDSNSNFDSTTNYRYTVPVSGFYFINAQIGIGSSGTNAIANTGAIYKNGSAVVVGPSMVGNGTSNALPRIQMNALLQLSAGDYIELWGYCGEGSRDIAGGANATYLTGFLVSQT